MLFIAKQLSFVVKITVLLIISPVREDAVRASVGRELAVKNILVVIFNDKNSRLSEVSKSREENQSDSQRSAIRYQ